MMADRATTIECLQALVCAPDGETIASERAAVDLIGEALSEGVEWVLIPVERLAEDFFHLKTGLAGQIVQKFVQYRRRLIILGDISGFEAESRAFRDFVYEANRGTEFWFLADLQEVKERLKRFQQQQSAG